MAVPYYTPPVSGDVMQDDVRVRIPSVMQDAVILETVWRDMDNGSAVKWYLKWRYIQCKEYHEVKRLLKQYGERIRNPEMYESFNRRALSLFGRRIESFK